jgi:hypothetical protein
MSRWAQGFVVLYFIIVQSAFQTFLSSLVSEQTKWSMSAIGSCPAGLLRRIAGWKADVHPCGYS